MLPCVVPSAWQQGEVTCVQSTTALHLCCCRRLSAPPCHWVMTSCTPVHERALEDAPYWVAALPRSPRNVPHVTRRHTPCSTTQLNGGEHSPG